MPWTASPRMPTSAPMIEMLSPAVCGAVTVAARPRRMVAGISPFAGRRLDGLDASAMPTAVWAGVSLARWKVCPCCRSLPGRSAFNPGPTAAKAHTANTRPNPDPVAIALHRFVRFMVRG